MKVSIFGLVAALLGISCQAQETNPDYELLWEVSKPGEQPSYLFGSLHSNDRRLFDLPDSLYVALDRSETIVLETDIFSIFETNDTRYDSPDLKFDRNGKPYTTTEVASRTAYGDENGMPQFLDAFFQQYCLNAGKNFETLESIEFQMGLADNLSVEPSFGDSDYEMMLTTREDMTNLYLRGDIYELNAYVKSGLSLYPDLYESLIVSRNITMTQVLDSLIREEPLFCAIGAGHLAGPTGVLNLLRSRGYSVRKVLATYGVDPSKEEVRVKSFRNYTAVEPLSGLKMTFPGKPLEITDELATFLKKWVYSDLGQGNTYTIELYERGDILSWEDAAAEYIPSPEDSPYEQIELPNGGEAIQGLGQEYWDFYLSWIRVLMTEEYVIVLKATGGNKFMNSPRAFLFFDKVSVDR